jgi:hypothetical protein
MPRTFLVKGKTALHVVYENEENGALACSCAGFKFRKQCSHVNEIIEKRKERQEKHEVQKVQEGNGVLTEL